MGQIVPPPPGAPEPEGLPAWAYITMLGITLAITLTIIFLVVRPQ